MRDNQKISRMKTLSENLLIFFIDIFTIVSAFRLAVFLRTDLLPVVYPKFPEEITYKGITDVWWILVIWLFFFYYEGLYSKRLSFWDEIKTLWKSSFFSTIGVFTVISIGKLSGDISRTIVINMGILAVLLLPLVRTAVKKTLRRFGLLKRRVLILGAGETGKLVQRALWKEPNFGYEVIGFLDDDPDKVGTEVDGVKVHKGIDKACQYVNRCGITDLIIAMPGAGKEKLQKIINNLQHKVDRILFVPDMFGIAVLGTSLQHFFHEQAFAFDMKNNLSMPLNIFVKRCFDLLLSILFIPVIVAVTAVIAVFIKMDSEGPVIFSQERIGERGKPFKCLKFRTMYTDADERLARLLQTDAAARAEWENFWKLRNDPRVTKVGRFLRATSLDELPQILNVLAGHMSIIGPRPYLPNEKEDIVGEDCHTILLARPGITGLWQVSGRSNTNYNYRIALDSWYVRNWNLWLDIVILFKTIKVVLTQDGAR